MNVMIIVTFVFSAMVTVVTNHIHIAVKMSPCITELSRLPMIMAAKLMKTINMLLIIVENNLHAITVTH